MEEEEEEEKVLGDEMCVHGLTLPSSNCVYSKIRPPWEIYEREREENFECSEISCCFSGSENVGGLTNGSWNK